MISEALREAIREARGEAAPFVALAMVGFVALALVSQSANWQLTHGIGWWFWLIAAVPYGALALTFAMGLGQNRTFEQRRAVVTGLLGIIVSLTVVETALLIASLVESSNLRISGPQLLMSAVVLWVSNIIAFGLAFWELDCGGPVRRALAERRVTPDIQFPQDENPTLARPGWTPHLLDYLYLSTTNSIAFSPTDAMPLTRPAKALMTIESAVSIVAVLFIAARAVNILHP
jgi:hypothetical protein